MQTFPQVLIPDTCFAMFRNTRNGAQDEKRAWVHQGLRYYRKQRQQAAKERLCMVSELQHQFIQYSTHQEQKYKPLFIQGLVAYGPGA